MKSNFVYPRNNRSPLVGHDVRKNPSSSSAVVLSIANRYFQHAHFKPIVGV